MGILRRLMAIVVPKTVGESLYWSYANLAMSCSFRGHDELTLQKIDYIIRNKIYYGLLRGTLQLGSFLNDEQLKIALAGLCHYCGDDSNLSLDHLIPQFRNGEHSANNLVEACRSCNSSKGSLDFLEWMAKKGAFPPLGVLRRYLKLAIIYCVHNGLMQLPLEGMQLPLEGVEEIRPPLPFALALLPYEYPIHDLVVVGYEVEEEDESDKTVCKIDVPPDAGDAWEPPTDGTKD
jgi:HNH endonuclease